MFTRDTINAWLTIIKNNTCIPNDVFNFIKSCSIKSIELTEIKLDDIDKKIILLCKGHLEDKYPFKDTWTNTLVDFYRDHYGLNPDEYPKRFKSCIFYKLLGIQRKLSENEYQRSQEIDKIFQCVFEKGIIRNDDEPIERGISELCGIIQCARYLDAITNLPRYSLKI
jgi:hypothetical protein